MIKPFLVRRRILTSLGSLPALSVPALGGAISLFGADAGAQSSANWPIKPVRLIVPFPPGGGTDAVARPLSKVLSQGLGQQVVIDNRGGAGGTLGADLAAKAAPDGYTFLIGAVHHTIAPSLYPSLAYDLLKDLTPVTPLAFVPNVVVVNPQRMNVRNFAEFSAAVKAAPDKYNFGSAGNGTSHQLAVELWKSMTGSAATHVPYRGAGPALADLLAGQIDFMFDGLGSSIQHIRSGKLRPLAVTSAKRSFLLPDLPTIGETVKGYEAQTWYGVWAPASTPLPIIQRVQIEIAKQFAAGGELRGIWHDLGADPGGQPPQELTRLVESEMVKWAKVVKDSGAKLD
jgi:tripartite-type tricarboxylate transporter receptor subunit TctC